MDSKIWEYGSFVLFGTIVLADLQGIDLILLVIGRVSATIFFILRAVCYFKKLKKK